MSPERHEGRYVYLWVLTGLEATEAGDLEVALEPDEADGQTNENAPDIRLDAVRPLFADGHFGLDFTRTEILARRKLLTRFLPRDRVVEA